MRTVASIHDRVTDIGAYLREQRESARLSVRQLASLAGVSNPYLSQVERGLRNPSAEVLQQIAKGLRISAEALYVRAGILDEDLRIGVERAVHADPELSDRQKRVLLDIYASFRAENARAAAEDVAAAVPRRRPSTRTTSSVPTAAARVRKPAGADRPVRVRRRAAAAAEPAGLSDTVQSDTGLSDTGLSDTGLSDTGLSDTGLSDTVLSDTVQSDTVQSDTVQSDTGLPTEAAPSPAPRRAARKRVGARTSKRSAARAARTEGPTAGPAGTTDTP